MHVPFAYQFTPANIADVKTLKLFDVTNNKILAGMVAQDATLVAFGLGRIINLIAGDEDAFAAWVTALSVTCDHGCSVTLGGATVSGGTVVALWTTYGTRGGNGGHAERWQDQIGPFIPAAPRIVITPGADADGATVFNVSGHVELLPQ